VQGLILLAAGGAFMANRTNRTKKRTQHSADSLKHE